jgi:hypothetical protein
MFEILLIATIIFVEISGTTRARRDLKNSSPNHEKLINKSAILSMKF